MSYKTVGGTIVILAPEIFENEHKKHIKYDNKIDIFALGLTILAIIQGNVGPWGLIPKVEGTGVH